jgi:hypothetical protein
MTSWKCYENKWFYMKYIGKYHSISGSPFYLHIVGMFFSLRMQHRYCSVDVKQQTKERIKNICLKYDRGKLYLWKKKLFGLSIFYPIFFELTRRLFQISIDVMRNKLNIYVFCFFLMTFDIRSEWMPDTDK